MHDKAEQRHSVTSSARASQASTLPVSVSRLRNIVRACIFLVTDSASQASRSDSATDFIPLRSAGDKKSWEKPEQQNLREVLWGRGRSTRAAMAPQLGEIESSCRARRWTGADS